MAFEQHFIRRAWPIFLMILIIVLFHYLFIRMPPDELAKDNIVKLYYADNISVAHESLIDRFNEEFAGRIEVVPINLPFSKFSTNERKELLARTLRSRSDRIDLFTVDVIWAPRFAKWCVPLDEYFSQYDREQILDHVMESCYYNGKLVAFPHYTDIALMYYHRGILESLPNADRLIDTLMHSITWEDFITLNRRMKQLGYKNPFYVYPADNFEGLTCAFFEGVRGLGYSLFEDSMIQLNTPGGRQSLQLLVDLIHTYGLTPEAVSEFDEYKENHYSINNKAVFFRGWPGFVKQNFASYQDTAIFQYAMLPLPHFKNGKPSHVYGGWNYMISKYSTKKEAAIQFIRFMLRERSQKSMFDIGGYIPANKKVFADSLYMADRPNMQLYLKLLKHGVHRPYLEEYTKMSDVISYYVHTAIKNRSNIETALDQANAAIRDKQVLIK